MGMSERIWSVVDRCLNVLKGPWKIQSDSTLRTLLINNKAEVCVCACTCLKIEEQFFCFHFNIVTVNEKFSILSILQQKQN